jgi:hypothetical protein
MKHLLLLCTLALSVPAFASQYTIDPPKGSKDVAFNEGWVRFITQQTQSVIASVGDKFGFKGGDKIPLPTWLCVAYTLAANGMEAARLKAGITAPSEMERHYRERQRQHCNDGDDGRRGVEIFKAAQRAYGQKHHNRELDSSLDTMAAGALAAKLMEMVGGKAAPAVAPAGWFFLLDPRLFSAPRTSPSDPNQGT